jgi:invasion protein IalB
LPYSEVSFDVDTMPLSIDFNTGGGPAMRIRWSPVVQTVALIALASLSASSGVAQQRPGRPPPPPAAPTAAQRAAQPPATAAEQPAAGQPQAGQAVRLNLQPGAGWSSKCASPSRQAAVECSLEQTVVVTSSGQLLASVVLRVAADTRQPVMLIQVPVGLYLPAGVTLQIDDGKPLPLALQTCDLKGCYTGMPVAAETIAAMKSGKLFKIAVQNMARENINIPLALDNFADAYQKIQ